MKKILIFLVFLGAYNSSFAFLTQSNWRWRNNNGSETTATWRANQNVAITDVSNQEVLRLRIEIYNTNNDPVNLEDSLQYSTTPAIANSWTNILAGDATRAFMMAGTNGFVVQNEPTTTQITGNAYVYVPGKLMVDTAILKFITIPSSNRSEFEWAIIGTPNAVPNTTYYFRHWGSSSNNLPPGVTYPSLTTSSTLAISLAGFSVSNEGKKVKLQWSTTSEQNNDRFDVERSNDSRTWSAIASVKGNGTTSQVHHYFSYDEKPINGINYYRLKQFDLNGKISMSPIKAFNFEEGFKAIAMVSPNPVRGAVSFKLSNTNATNLLAVFSDANGKIIYQEKFKNIQADVLNKLNFKQQLAAGVYILKLQSEGLLESIKVVVQ